jgi:ribA/ribD-fused uncharacterized protein
MSKEAIVKRNLAFIYGRSNAENQLPDPDKVAYVRSAGGPKEKLFDPDTSVFDFSGEFEALSPSYPTPVCIPNTGIIFPSFEHALQASKFINITAHAETISSFTNAIEVKRYINKLKHTDNTLQANWNEYCIETAEILLRDKFFRSKDCRKVLMRTGHRKLCFRNSFQDLFWGMNDVGQGQNHLGKLLEKIRHEIDHGEDIFKWIGTYIHLLSAEDARVEVNVYKDDTLVNEDCKIIDMQSIILIGKNEENDVVCAHPSISRTHALLVLDSSTSTDSGGMKIIDLDSSNGTYVNNMRLAPYVFTTISSSDEVKVGHSSRIYRCRHVHNARNARNEELLEKVNSSSASGGGQDTVFVGNLPPGTREEDLRGFFAVCGEIINITIPRSKGSGGGTSTSRGIAFVTFSNGSGVLQAVGRDGDDFLGVAIRVKKSDNNRSSNTSSGGSNNSRSTDNSRGGKDERSYYGPSSREDNSRYSSSSDYRDSRSSRNTRSRSRSRDNEYSSTNSKRSRY